MRLGFVMYKRHLTTLWEGFILRKIYIGSLFRWDWGLLLTRDSWPPSERGRVGVYFEKDRYGLIMYKRHLTTLWEGERVRWGEGVYFEKDRYGLFMQMRWGFVMYKRHLTTLWEGERARRGPILRNIDMGSLCKWDGFFMYMRHYHMERGGEGGIFWER